MSEVLQMPQVLQTQLISNTLEPQVKRIETPPIIHTLIDIQSLSEEIKHIISDIYEQAYPGDYCGFDAAFRKIDKVFLTIINNKIVASVSLTENRILRLGVHPDYLKQGIATQMLTKLKEKNPSLWLSAGTKYPNLHSLLGKSGFKICDDEDKIQNFFPESSISRDEITNNLSVTNLSKTTIHKSGYAQYIFN